MIRELKFKTVEDFCTILVNSFANSEFCGYYCPFKNGVCEALFPDDKNNFCDMIDIAQKLGIVIDFSNRSNNKNMNRKLVKEMNQIQNIHNTLFDVERDLNNAIKKLEKIKIKD